MAKVFFHYKETSDGEWNNEGREFSRIPCVGEYVGLSTSGEWHRIYAVIHCSFDAEFEAEVYSTPTPNGHIDVVKANAPFIQVCVSSVTSELNKPQFRAGESVTWQAVSGATMVGVIDRIEANKLYLVREGDLTTYIVYDNAVQRVP